MKIPALVPINLFTKKVKKNISVCLLTTFLFQSVPASSQAVTHFIPPATPIALIQDIHAHLEAQKSIEETLRQLQKKRNKKIRVGVEGAAGVFDFSPYAAFPDKTLSKSIVSDLLEEGLVSGPVHSGFLNADTALFGVETPRLYVENVESYRSALPLQKKLHTQIDLEQRRLINEKKAIFSLALDRLDSAVENHRSGKTELADFIEELNRAGANNTFAVEIYKAASDSEKKLSFSAIEREKRHFVDVLAQTFSASDLNWVRNWSATVENSVQHISRRFETLLHAASAKGIDVRRFPLLVDYVRYLKLADVVDAAQLFSDLRDMERDAYARLTKGNPAAEALVQKSRRLYLTSKLIHFELSPEEWEEYKQAVHRPWPMDRRLLSSFENFYHLAEKRNLAMAKHALRYNLDAIVVGGFHTPGISYFLESMGRKVNVIRPHVTKIDLDSGSAYLNVFAREKTPLEKFLLRWKLFLAHPASLGTNSLVDTSRPDASEELTRRYMARKPTEAKFIRQIFSRLQSGAHNTAWAWETALLIPLVIGLEQSHLALSITGFVAGVVGLVTIHFWRDGFQFMQQRTIWSLLITFASLVGYGLLDSWVAGLGTASFVHYLNHFAMHHSGSWITQLLFNHMALPRVEMSSVPPPANDFSEDENAAKTKMAEAIKVWRAGPQHNNWDKSLNDEEDVVTQLIDTYSEELTSSDEDQSIRSVAIAKGLASALKGLTVDEWKVRAYRDFMKGFDRAYRVPAGPNQKTYQMDHVHFAYSIYDMAKQTNIIRSDSQVDREISSLLLKSIHDANARIVRSVFERSRGKHRSQEEFSQMWNFLSGEFFNFEFPHNPQLTQIAHKMRFSGIVGGFIAAQVSPEEIESRMVEDFGQFGVRPSGNVGPAEFVEKAYSALRTHGTESSQDKHLDAMERADIVLTEKEAFRLVVSALSEKKTFVTDELKKFLLGLNQKHKGKPDLQKKYLHAARRAFVAAIHSHGNFEEKIAWMESDFKTLLANVRNDVTAVTSNSLRIVQHHWYFGFLGLVLSDIFDQNHDQVVLRLYPIVEQHLEHTHRTRNIITTAVDAYAGLQMGGVGIPLDPFHVFPFLIELKQQKLLKREEIVSLLANVYLRSALTPDTRAKQITMDLEDAVRNVMTSKQSLETAQLLFDAFEVLAQGSEQGEVYSAAINVALDRTEDLRNAWTAPSSEETVKNIEDSVKIISMITIFIRGSRIKSIREKTADILVSHLPSDQRWVVYYLQHMSGLLRFSHPSGRGSDATLWIVSGLRRLTRGLNRLYRTVQWKLMELHHANDSTNLKAAIDMQEMVYRHAHLAFQKWRKNSQQDAIPLKLKELQLIWGRLVTAPIKTAMLLGMLEAYRNAYLRDSELKDRFARDMQAVFEVRVEEEDGSPASPVLMLDFSAMYMASYTPSNAAQSKIRDGILEGLRAGTEKEMRLALQEFKGDQGSSRFQKLYTVLREDLSELSSYFDVAVASAVGVLETSDLTAEQLEERAKFDVGRERVARYGNSKLKPAALEVYEALSKKLKQASSPDKKALAAAIDRGLLAHYAVASELETLPKLKAWNPQSPADPFPDLEDQIFQLLELTQSTKVEREKIVDHIAEGVNIAFAKAKLDSSTKAQMFKLHVAGLVKKSFSAGAGVSLVDSLGWAIKVFDYDTVHHKEAVREGFLEGYKEGLSKSLVAARALTASSQAFQAVRMFEPLLALWSQPPKIKIDMRDLVPRIWPIVGAENLTNEEYGFILSNYFGEVFNTSESHNIEPDKIKTFVRYIRALADHETEGNKQFLIKTLRELLDPARDWAAAVAAWRDSGEWQGPNLVRKILPNMSPHVQRFVVVAQLKEEDAKHSKKLFVERAKTLDLNSEELRRLTDHMMLEAWNVADKKSQGKEKGAEAAALIASHVGVLASYFEVLAQSYFEQGDIARAEGILVGLATGHVAKAGDHRNNPHLEAMVVRNLKRHIDLSLKMNSFKSVLITFKNLKQFLNADDEALTHIPFMAKTLGLARIGIGDKGRALRLGFQYVLSINRFRLSTKIVPTHEWLQFAADLLQTAELQTYMGLYQTALITLQEGLALPLEVPEKKKMQILSTFNRMQTETDGGTLRSAAAEIEENVLSLISSSGAMTLEDRKFYSWVLMETLARACRTGDPHYKEKLIQLIDKNNVKQHEAHPLRSQAQANLFLAGYTDEGLIDSQITDEPESYHLLSHVTILLAQKKYSEANQTLDALERKNTKDLETGRVDSFYYGFVQGQIQIMQMVSLSQEVDVTSAVQKTAAALRRFLRHIDKNAVIFEDFGYLYADDQSKTQVVIDAIDHVIGDRSSEPLSFHQLFLLMDLSTRLSKKAKNTTSNVWELALRSSQKSLETLPPFLKDLIKKHHKTISANVIGKKQIEAKRDANWFGKTSLIFEFTHHIFEFEDRFKNIPNDVSLLEWVEKYSLLHADINYLAGIYALSGFPEESEALLKYGHSLKERGLQKYNRGVDFRELEATWLYTRAAGDLVRSLNGLLAQANHITSGRLVVTDYLVSIIQGLAMEFPDAVWASGTERTQKATQLLGLLKKLLAQTTRKGSVFYVALSQCAEILGNLEDARQYLLQGAQGRFDPQIAQRTAPPALLTIYWASQQMKNKSLAWPRRLKEVERLLDSISYSDGYDVQVKTQKLSNRLMQYESKPAELEVLVQDYIAALDSDDTNQEWPGLFTAGFLFEATQAAVFLGPENPLSKILMERIRKIKNQFQGESVAFLVNAALQFFDSVKENNPSAFMSWADQQPSSLRQQPLLLNAMRLALASPDDRSELIRFVTQKRSDFSTKNQDDQVVEILSSFPLTRQRFMAMTLALIDTFHPQDWQKTIENQKSVEVLKSILSAASYLGDLRILMAFDRLMANKTFPHKEWLATLIKEMEPALSEQEWEERIKNFPDATPERFEKLCARAMELLGADKKSWVDSLAEARRNRNVQKEHAERTIHEANGLYRKWKFTEALTLLNTVPSDILTEETSALRVRVKRGAQAWDQYQNMQFDEALRVLPNDEASADPVLGSLRQRITSLMDVYQMLSDRRPRKAEKIHESILVTEGQRADPIYERTRNSIDQVFSKVQDAFEKGKSALEESKNNPEEIEKLRKYVTLLRGRDSEASELIDLLITEAEQALHQKQYSFSDDLIHVACYAGGLWDLANENKEFKAKLDKALRIRKLARAYEMRDLHQKQLTVYDAALDATQYLEANGPDGKSTFEGKTFHVSDNWSIDARGMVAVSNLDEIIKSKKRPDGSPQITESKRINSLGDLKLPPGRDFLLMFHVNGIVVRVPVNFVRVESSRERGERELQRELERQNIPYVAQEKLLFMVDSEGAKQLRWVLEQNGKFSPTLVYVRDIESVLYSVHLSHTVRYLSDVIFHLENKGPGVESDKKLDKYLGLDITPQFVDPEIPFERIQVNGQNTPIDSQDEATRAGLSAPVTVVQGPPGTGKSHVLTQIIATAVSVLRKSVSSEEGEQTAVGGASRKGEIVLLVAASHAAVDAVADKITEQNVPLVRFASKEASEKIDPKIRPYYENNFSKLWKLIRVHHRTGQGFVVAGTIMGIFGDSKCMTLLQMYMGGHPMAEIEKRYIEMGGVMDTRNGTQEYSRSHNERVIIKPVCAIDEAGQANTAQTEIIYFRFHPSQWLLFGDHFQLPPYFSADEFGSLFKEAMRRGFVLPQGSVEHILTTDVIQAMSISIFELVHTYAEKWAKIVDGKKQTAGVALGFLDHALRSVWPITDLISKVFYGGRLVHRQASLPKEEWDSFEDDTIMVLKTDGKVIREEKGTSSLNFQEAGMVIQTITYYLNLKDTMNHYLYNPEDILIISPYKAQVKLMREVIQIVAVMNDIVRNDDVSADEISEVCSLISEHWRLSGNKESVANLLTSLKTVEATRVRTANLLLAKLQSLYDLHSDETRLIRREFLPKNGNGRQASSVAFFGRMRDTQEGKGAKANRGNVLDPDTIDSVQGGEKKVVIVSMVRNDGATGFLKNYRLNVALSRAKEKLAIVTSEGFRLQRMDDIVKAAKKMKSDFTVITTVPRAMDRRHPPTASLRQAWNISTGNRTLDRNIDVYAMPPLETVVFLSVLAIGLSSADTTFIVLGFFLKILIFPMLHVWGDSKKYNWEREVAFAGQLTGLYLLTWLSLAMFAPGLQNFSEWIAMLPVLLRHSVRNKKAVDSKSLNQALPVESLDVDSVQGVSPTTISFDLPMPESLSLEKELQRARLVGSGA